LVRYGGQACAAMSSDLAVTSPKAAVPSLPARRRSRRDVGGDAPSKLLGAASLADLFVARACGLGQPLLDTESGIVAVETCDSKPCPWISALRGLVCSASSGGSDANLSEVVAGAESGRARFRIKFAWRGLVIAAACAATLADGVGIVRLGEVASAVAGALEPYAWPSTWWPSAKFFEHAANLCSSCFYLSPVVQMTQVYSSEGAALGNVNPQTMILMFFNCTLWVIWGVFLPMWPAVPGNVLGLSAAVCYLIFCWSYVMFRGCSSPRWGRTAALATGSAFVLLLLIAMYAQGSTSQAQQVGFLAMFICICLFASPLSELGQVIQEKSSERLPPVQCLMQFLNCSLWLVVGVNSKAVQVLVCNGMGFLLAFAQLTLIAVFPSSSGRAKQVLP